MGIISQVYEKRDLTVLHFEGEWTFEEYVSAYPPERGPTAYLLCDLTASATLHRVDQKFLDKINNHLAPYDTDRGTGFTAYVVPDELSKSIITLYIHGYDLRTERSQNIHHKVFRTVGEAEKWLTEIAADLQTPEIKSQPN